MNKRLTQVIATAGTLGIGVLLGSMMLSPTSAAPVDTDPAQTPEPAVLTAGETLAPGETMMFTDGAFAAECFSFGDGMPVPPTGATSPGISVTEEDGKVVVTDEDGNVLHEAELGSSDAMVAFQVEDGKVIQVDPNDLPPLPETPFPAGEVIRCDPAD